MRSRLSTGTVRKGEGVKVLTVTREGVLKVFSKAPIPTKEIKARQHVQLDENKRKTFWALDSKIAQKVALFKKNAQLVKDFQKKERERMMNNVDNWFHRANKLALG